MRVNDTVYLTLLYMFWARHFDLCMFLLYDSRWELYFFFISSFDVYIRCVLNVVFNRHKQRAIQFFKCHFSSKQCCCYDFCFICVLALDKYSILKFALHIRKPKIKRKKNQSENIHLFMVELLIIYEMIQLLSHYIMQLMSNRKINI